jgi:threonine dehydrogenase-like Zn-dependent dehydrogenase
VKAMSVVPGDPGSAAAREVPDPPESDGPILVAGLLAGICGTDAELIAGFGEPPPGHRHLVLGHESLGRPARRWGGARRSGHRHRAPPRPGALPGLRVR